MDIHKKYFRISLLSVILCMGFIFSTTSIQAEVKSVKDLPQSDQNRVIKGIVFEDDGGITLAGATVVIKGTTRGVITDNNGSFTIDVKESDVLVIQYIGMETVELNVKDNTNFNITLKPKADIMDEVTVVAFATQKKESVISAISTINPSELKVPTSNLTQTLGGRIAGLISFQRSGEPGLDNAEFFIRGVTTFGYAANPLILIDGVELTSSDLARLQPDDIASFSIMKDAAATALYGARGANGVILVTTKEGREGPTRFNIRFENSFSMSTEDVDIVDPITYMQLHNEAVQTRDPLEPRPYSDQKIEGTIMGLDPIYYPSTNWQDELFKNYTSNQRINANLSGGGRIARYYIAATLNNDNGILNVDERNNFNSNINIKRIQIRSNTNLNVTPTTEVSVKFSSSFDSYNGPLDTGGGLYQKVMKTNPVLFPKYYEPTKELEHSTHTLFGNAEGGNYLNPYADMVKGYKESSTTVLIAQFEAKQNLKFITEGLSARLLVSTTRNSSYAISRQYNPFWYNISYYDPEMSRYGLMCINPDGGTEYLRYNEGAKVVSSAVYLEAVLNYNRTFKEKHDVSGLFVYTMRESETGNAGSLLKSLASRNLGLAGRLTYAYDNRYFIEGNFGFNGSERFSEDKRFGFFPSGGLGWIVSNESFWPQNNTVTNLKLKGTIGYSGNDNIGGASERFFYLSDINMNNGGKAPISFGENFGEKSSGISINRYENKLISWETAVKMNFGVEVKLFDRIDVQMDYFSESRTNILMERSAIPLTMGLQAVVKSNVGESHSSGFETSISANHHFNNDFWVSGRFNFTYAKGYYDVYEEPDYGYSWLSRENTQIGQMRGLIAERLFIDEADIANSPEQTFGPVMPGDIKYKDINEDGKITSQDIVPIGYPTTPNIMYGFGASMGYKGFDFSFFFQGAGQSSFYINQTASAPFINTASDGIQGNNAMLQVWADNHWSETNRDPYALWPRLSDNVIDNNNQNSTWFLRDNSYLRLKSVEIGYEIPSKIYKRIGLESFRVYLSGLNLLSFSKFDLWDPEMGGNGLGYPIQRVFNIGVNVNF